jgi:hypothetical protein
MVGTHETFNAHRDITLLTVGLASLLGMKSTRRKHQLDCALCERNDVMLHGLEALDVFVDAVFTQTDLAAVTKFFDRLNTV